MTDTTGSMQLVKRNDHEYEQVVMGEVLIPDIPNSFGDIYTREAIREFCYEFARQRDGIDIDHDEVDVTGTHAYVVESFIARKGDPDFIEGSWVVGMKITDAETWLKVLSGELAGYSFTALVEMYPVVFQNMRNRQISGLTEPDPVDGHQHPFLVIINPFNRPVSGGTGVVNGHSHKILTHTVTASADDESGRGHKHRFQVIVAPTEGD